MVTAAARTPGCFAKSSRATWHAPHETAEHHRRRARSSHCVLSTLPCAERCFGCFEGADGGGMRRSFIREAWQRYGTRSGSAPPGAGGAMRMLAKCRGPSKRLTCVARDTGCAESPTPRARRHPRWSLAARLSPQRPVLPAPVKNGRGLAGGLGRKARVGRGGLQGMVDRPLVASSPAGIGPGRRWKYAAPSLEQSGPSRARRGGVGKARVCKSRGQRQRPSGAR